MRRVPAAGAACGCVPSNRHDRLHFSLDIDNLQTPIQAFSDKTAAEKIRADNPEWMGVDAND